MVTTIIVGVAAAVGGALFGVLFTKHNQQKTQVLEDTLDGVMAKVDALIAKVEAKLK